MEHVRRPTKDQLSSAKKHQEVERLHGQGHRVFLGGASQGCTVALVSRRRLRPLVKPTCFSFFCFVKAAKLRKMCENDLKSLKLVDTSKILFVLGLISFFNGLLLY